jgi:hypothetical protein
MESKNKKYLLIIDSILLAGLFLLAFIYIGYSQPLVTGSFSEESSSLMFEIPSDTDYVIVDDNLQFDSPKTLFIGDVFSLDPGRYYIKSFFESSGQVRELSSEIILNLQVKRTTDDSMGIFNVNKFSVHLDTYNIGSLVNSSEVKGGTAEK